MNKDRAIEVLEDIKFYIKNRRDRFLEQKDFNNEVDKKMVDSEIKVLTEDLQAIDYAIERMKNDNLLERLENGKCKKHSSNKVVAYNREWLFIHLEREFELQKAERDILEELRNKNLSDDELAERLSKGLEPYVRSEE